MTPSTRFLIPRIEIERARGDSLSLSFQVREKVSGDAIDISSATIKFATASERGAAVIDSKTVGDGVTIDDGPNGRFSVDYELARGSYPAGSYAFDVEVTNGGVRRTYVAGTLRVLEEVAV